VNNWTSCEVKKHESARQSSVNVEELVRMAILAVIMLMMLERWWRRRWDKRCTCQIVSKMTCQKIKSIGNIKRLCTSARDMFKEQLYAENYGKCNLNTQNVDLAPKYDWFWVECEICNAITDIHCAWSKKLPPFFHF